MRTVHIIESDETPKPVKVVGEDVTILAGGDTTKPFEVHVQEGVLGGGPPPHFHPWDEAFYVLEGEVEVTVEGKSTVLTAGGYVHIPGNTVHAYKNLSASAKILGIVSDPRGGEFFAAVDKLKVPDDLPRLMEIAQEFDLSFVKPADAG